MDSSRFTVLRSKDQQFDNLGFEIFDEISTKSLGTAATDEKPKSDSGFESERHLKKMNSISSTGTISRAPRDIVELMRNGNSEQENETIKEEPKQRLYKKHSTEVKSRRRKLRGRKLRNLKVRSVEIWTRGMQWAQNATKDVWPFTSSNSASGTSAAESDNDFDERSKKMKSRINPVYHNTSTDNDSYIDSSIVTHVSRKPIAMKLVSNRKMMDADKKFKIAHAVVRATEAFAKNRERKLAARNANSETSFNEPQPSTSGLNLKVC